MEGFPNWVEMGDKSPGVFENSNYPRDESRGNLN